MSTHKKKLSEEIEALLKEPTLTEESGRRGITIGKFFDSISHRRGFGIILLLFSLPVAIPAPAVGLGPPLGLLIVLSGLQLLAGRNSFWLPNKISQKRIPPGFIMFLRQKGVPFLKKIERRLKRRMEFITQRTLRLPIGLIIVLMGAIIMLPIPFTNTLPAFVVFILALGLATDDGLFILGGLVAGITLLVICLVIVIFATSAFL